MPYPAQHALVTWLGDTYDGLETWQFGLRFLLTGSPGLTSAEVLFGLGEDLLTGAAGMQPSHRLTGTKIAIINPDGKYPEGIDAVFYEAPTPVPGVTSSQLPAQVALAVTTLTGVSRGRGSRGRFFLPTSSLCQVSPDTGLMSESLCSALGTAAAAFVQACEDEMGNQAVVASSLGAGVFRAITATRVGRVPDTQRRRRRSLDEAPVGPFPLVP